MESTNSDGCMWAQLVPVQIFNSSHLREKIEDGYIGFPNPCPTTQGGPDVHYFILVDDASALKTRASIHEGS